MACASVLPWEPESLCHCHLRRECAEHLKGRGNGMRGCVRHLENSACRNVTAHPETGSFRPGAPPRAWSSPLVRALGAPTPASPEKCRTQDVHEDEAKTRWPCHQRRLRLSPRTRTPSIRSAAALPEKQGHVACHRCDPQLVHPLLFAPVPSGRGVKRVSMCFRFPDKNCLFHNRVLWAKAQGQSRSWAF